MQENPPKYIFESPDGKTVYRKEVGSDVRLKDSSEIWKKVK